VNASTECARTLVDELVRLGVREAVLSPGSRSAPIAFALQAAEAAGTLRLHVRIDERTAGFLALGLAKSSGRLVPVATTSGTAAANLHPAVLEADHAGVPLLALTADRPMSLRGSGANQTTDQVKLYGDAVRLFAELAATGPASWWRAAVCRAAAAAAGLRTGDPGPVHLNVGFDVPLMPLDEDPAADGGGSGPGDGRPGGVPWTVVNARPPALPVLLPPGLRTVVLAGDDAGPAARRLAEDGGWPLLAEPSSGARTGEHALRSYRLLLAESPLAAEIERVVVFGRPTLSRQTTSLLSRGDLEVVAVAPGGRWSDVGLSVRQVLPAAAATRSSPQGWLGSWRDADSAVSAAVDGVLSAEPGLTPYAVARTVADALPAGGLLVAGSSNPIRDLDLMAAPYEVGGRRKVLANRGLSGIDGTVSTAVGAALGRSSSRALALLGDLTFLHDSTGLVIGRDEPVPDLTIVVVNDDGGGIFTLLEQGDGAYAGSFERIFGTPHGSGLAALCAAYSTAYALVSNAGSLARLLEQPAHGLRVVEAPVDRAGRRDLERRIRAAAADALR
jgi:2-succinyl-5-enolpyruvyl-6-hydroxy-3-cyclohexene-1-carboxylate synthase